ncbi:hypothetical protein BD413DRAFT_146404 [Trametes elegans]|nr:hypothetical protein BD413DRAFT_146404 [Trametes elegans]
MLGSVLLASSAILSLASGSAAGVVRARAGVPLDGQYIDVNAQNDATEWWWFQAAAPIEEGKNSPSLHVTFYEGYPISALREAAGGANAPEYYILINGAYPNGELISHMVPASSASVTYEGEAVNGKWAGAGEFHNAADLSTVTIKLDAPDYDISGTIEITSNGPGHFPCNSTTSPYFDSILSEGTALSANEDAFFNHLGWPTAQPGGKVTVDVVLNGTALKFSGKGYHDQNWMPHPVDAFIDDWYYMNAQIGPYDLSAVYAAITGSTRDTNTGFLARDGVILQNQCSLQGSRDKDFVTLTPYGKTYEPETNVTLMNGFILDYTLSNGDEYWFNISASQSLMLGQAIYHRFVGPAVGGRSGVNSTKVT